MKYIRTKDGKIKGFEVKNEKLDLIKYLSQFANYQGDYAPIKQADTVEELCDKYYGVDENGKVVRVHNWSKDSYPPKPHEWAVDGFCTKKDITISELKNRFPKGIFGAVVWFDNKSNLHIDIVAKMNEKGDLELI